MLLATTQVATAGAVVTGFETNTLPANDDGFVGPVGIGFTVNFFGLVDNQLWVNNNGNVTFGSGLSTFTPFGLGTVNLPQIAPFFADVDTRVGNVTKYGTGSFDGHGAFGATWRDVGYYDEHIDKLNTFQLLLVDRSDTGAGNFDIVFNYDKIQWETGDASGGIGGFGPISASAGYTNGQTPPTFFPLPGSLVPGAFLDSNLVTGLTHNHLNSDVNGRYIFSAREGTVTGGEAVPEPASMSLLAVGAFGMIGYRARRRKPATP